MQLQFRVDDNNSLTVDFKLSKASPGGFTDGPEIISAVVSDSKLSDLTADQLFDLAGQIVDYFSQPHQEPKPVAEGDWRHEFLEATRT